MKLLDLFKSRVRPPEGEILAERLSQIPGFRVLRELGSTGLIDELSPRSADRRIVVIIDTETTGLDPTKDRLVEIAIERLHVHLLRPDP